MLDLKQDTHIIIQSQQFVFSISLEIYNNNIASMAVKHDLLN